MPFTFEQATVYLALAKKHGVAGDVDVALGFDRDGNVLNYGVADARTPYDSRSAIVNLIQGESRRIDQIACTHAPTERDLGMARMSRLKRINYLREGALYWKKRSGWSFSRPWSREKTLLPTGSDLRVIAEPADKTPAAAAAWYQKKVSTAAAVGKLRNVQTTYADSTQQTYFQREHTNLALPRFVHPAELVRNDPNPLRDQIFMHLAWAIVGEATNVRDSDGDYPVGHSIGSVLRGPKDEILAWGLNTNSEHWSLHGEVNLIQTYQNTVIEGRAIGARANAATRPILYSTLEPCFMCAGMFLEAGRGLHCRYGQDDPGIKKNALATARPVRQVHVDTRIGRLAASALKTARESKADLLKNIPVTRLLNNAINGLMQHSIQYYFDLVPPKDAPARDDWLNHTTVESHIWENGLKLLYHINDGVGAKWQARTDVNYDVSLGVAE